MSHYDQDTDDAGPAIAVLGVIGFMLLLVGLGIAIGWLVWG